MRLIGGGKLANESCRNPSPHDVRCHICDHDGAAAYDGAGADGDTRQHGNTRTQPSAATDANRFGHDFTGPKIRGAHLMSARYEEASHAHGNIVFKRHCGAEVEGDILVEIAAAADDQAAGDGTAADEPHATGNNRPVADMHAGQPIQTGAEADEGFGGQEGNEPLHEEQAGMAAAELQSENIDKLS